MRHLIRLLQRVAILALGAFAVWLIVFVIFRFAHQKLPLILAFSATYLAAAYLILPYAVRMGLKIQHRKHVPRYTITGDGLPGDPVNLALVGDLAQLRAAFTAAGWTGADRLDSQVSWGMVRAFLLNRPYPTAPFSSLYLFGRARTSASSRRSAIVRASAITCASGPRALRRRRRRSRQRASG